MQQSGDEKFAESLPVPHFYEHINVKRLGAIFEKEYRKKKKDNGKGSQKKRKTKSRK